MLPWTSAFWPSKPNWPADADSSLRKRYAHGHFRQVTYHLPNAHISPFSHQNDQKCSWRRPAYAPRRKVASTSASFSWPSSAHSNPSATSLDLPWSSPNMPVVSSYSIYLPPSFRLTLKSHVVHTWHTIPRHTYVISCSNRHTQHDLCGATSRSYVYIIINFLLLAII